MNILILGSGGRESAFAWKLSQSPLCTQIYIAPGNGGTEQYGTNLQVSPTDFEAIKKICLDNDIQIVLPGGEDSLVAGIFDYFQKDSELKNIIIVGPSQIGAQLEGSKSFAKQFMQRHQIPTATYKEFDISNFDEGVDYIAQHPLPIVLKADGLAAGKGVVITEDTEEAQKTFNAMIKEGAFGEASNKVVIEQFLSGIELSVFLFSDGENFVVLPEAKDYKRIGEGDTGLNTGGMGAVSPIPFADTAFMKKVIDRIAVPTIKGLKKENITYHGFIFLGLINVNGNPYVIEYNCRMGDPETEVVLPRLQNDLMELFLKMSKKELHSVKIQHSSSSAATIMMVSGGYPGAYQKDKTISGIEKVTESIVFQAGTKTVNNAIQTNGGRVLAVTSLAPTIDLALKQSYESATLIHFEGSYFRKDIGFEFKEETK